MDIYKLSKALRSHGWVVPAYSLPANAQDICVLRFVVRENFNEDMVEALLQHLAQAFKQEGLRAPEAPEATQRPIC